MMTEPSGREQPMSASDGALGWAPSHSSAWGRPSPATPRSLGIAVVEPQS